MAKTETGQPWQQIEQQAFHAYREWPIWLVLRQRELLRQMENAYSADIDHATDEHTNAGVSADDTKVADR